METVSDGGIRLGVTESLQNEDRPMFIVFS